jgi:DNA-binding NarL/FixJ family response regulator
MRYEELGVLDATRSVGAAMATAPTLENASPVVLVVEHDLAVANVLATLLENSGYRPVLTADGTTALAQVRAGAVDLVLLDRDLPECSGLELCRQIWDAARGAAVHLPVLTLTSATRPEDVCAGYAAGADDYVPKPFHPAELLARLRVWLQVRAQAAPDAPRGGSDVPPAAWATPASRPLPVPHREGLLPDLTEPLTAREFQVLDLLARRFSNKEIAAALCVSWQTVAKHTNNIYEKLRVPGRRDAVNRARALGILPQVQAVAGGR